MNTIFQKNRIFIYAIVVGIFASFLFTSSLAQGQSQGFPGQNMNAASFRDVAQNHPFASSIAQARQQNFVAGYPDGTFAPDSSISRAEFITMVTASTISNPQGANCFIDVQTQWFARFVCAAKERGILSGYPDGSFRPGNNINFAEASAIITRANNLRRPRTQGPWYKPAIMSLEGRAAIPVTIDYVERKISRGETAEILWRVKNNVTDKTTKTYAALTSPVPTINSCPELLEKFRAYEYRQSRNRFSIMERAMPMLAPSSSPSPTTSAGDMQAESQAADYSRTNVQVEGVDEADIVKNDGQYIYIVSGRTVRIVRAFPPASLASEARVEFDDQNFNPTDLYVDGNKLVVTGISYESESGPTPLQQEAPQTGAPSSVAPMIMPMRFNPPKTKIYVVDISNKQNPLQERSVAFDGGPISTRKIGSRLYLAINNPPNIYEVLQNGTSSSEIPMPTFLDSRVGNEQPIAGCADIRFIPQYDEINFLTVASIDINNLSSEVSRETIMGTGENIYVSEGSFYVAGTKYEVPEVGIFDVWAPSAVSNEKTSIVRFSIENGNVVFRTRGEVSGHILNQFSMDENENAFRIATTSGEAWSTQSPSQNHLFILDKNNLAAVLGSIQNMAPGERIYSVRFMGKRAYMVTFKKIDPFFVIDVENPSNPRILGELKIPGFSDYLHPFDENHIIGFGKEAVDPQEIQNAGIGANFNFAWYQGMKIALFDVTDVANPRMMFREVIGDRGTDSEVLYNHKALLYDRSRNIFAFPVTVAEIPNRLSGSYTGSQTGNMVFQGAYVYSLDLQNGFQFKGRVTHTQNQPTVSQTGYWLRQGDIIRRIVSIGDYLYTVSLGRIKVIGRDNMQEVGSTTLAVDLPPEGIVEPMMR